MALNSGDVLVYDGSQWNNQPSTSDVVNLVGPLRLNYSNLLTKYTSFTLGTDGSLTISTVDESADLFLQPRGNLELGTDLTDVINIGRTNAVLNGGILTTVSGRFAVTGQHPSTAGQSASATLVVTGSTGGDSGSAGTAGGAGGAVQLTAGAGGAISVGGGVAGAGAALTLTAGAGGAGSSNSTGGAGGDVSISGGAGGSSGSGTRGNGGALNLSGGAAGGAGASRGDVLMQTSGGEVGIGTSSPTVTLDVVGTTGIKVSSSTTGAMCRLAYTGGSPQSYNLICDTDGSFRIVDETAGSAPPRLRLSASTGYICIGSSVANSKLQVMGPIATAVTNVTTSPYNVTADDSVIRVGTDSAAITVNLPTASGITGRQYIIKRVSGNTNNVTITPNGSEKIDGAGNYILNVLNKYVAIVSDGTDWAIVANN